MSQRRTLTIIDDGDDVSNKQRYAKEPDQQYADNRRRRHSQSKTPTDERSVRRNRQRSPSNPGCSWSSDWEVVDACDMKDTPVSRTTRNKYRHRQSRSNSRSISPIPIRTERSIERSRTLDDYQRHLTDRKSRPSKHRNHNSHSKSPVDKRTYRKPEIHRSGNQYSTSDSSTSPDGRRRSSYRHKNWEVRRYNGKDDVEEYLVQFEITARYNHWTRDEMAMALLHALDGQARGVYNDLDDPASASYNQIKRALIKRFGLTSMAEVHEQALNRLKYVKGQNVRELAQQVTKLTRKAYPEINVKQRERFAIKSLLQALNDRDAIFYIKDKSPETIDEACTLFERYEALTGSDSRRPFTARTISQTTESTYSAAAADDLRAVRGDITSLKDQTERQFCKVADVLSQLTVMLKHDTKDNHKSLTSDTNDGHAPVTSQTRNVPRKPCPRCNQAGHWASDCPNQPSYSQQTSKGKPYTSTQCYECKEVGHRWRDCPKLGNAIGPMSAPDTRSAAVEQKQ